MSEYQLSFSSRLAAPPDEVWAWITSVAGISREMAPYLRMSVPRGVTDLSTVERVPGRPLFRSWILLFGVIPFDYSDLTLLRLDDGEGFIEESPMGTMRRWRHERRITRLGSGTMLTDVLAFEPRVLGPVSRLIVNAFFVHRHRRLVKYLGQPGAPNRP